jgi:acetolactate synthase I/II/III large subunit
MSDVEKPIVAETLLTALVDYGIDTIFANSGTDFAPIIEAYARLARKGATVPRFVTVPHENVAMAMAIGYANMTGRPAGVMVHVNVGTANALCGLMNASRDNAPILLMAGRTPLTEHGDIGSRDNLVQWAQENFDQGAMVREHVKWDYELRSGQPVRQLIARALDIANSEPKGPVYLTLPREVLAEATPAADADTRHPLAPHLGGAADSAIDEAARLFNAAKRPLIIAGRAGKSASGFAAVSAFAEKFSVPVCQAGAPNLPSHHPMNLGNITKEHLAWADLILLLDVPVPWIPRHMRPEEATKIISAGPDPLFMRYPFRAFRTDIALTGDCGRTLDALTMRLNAEQSAADADVSHRREYATTTRNRIATQRAAMLEKARDLSPIHPGWLASAINTAKPANAIIVNEIGVAADALDFSEAGCFLSGSAGGLGLAMGQSLGAKMAAPDRPVITVLGDGSYMLGVPVSAHFVAQAEKLATLTIIANNEMWFAVRRATLELYPDSEASRSNALPIIDLKPSPAYEKIIEGFGGYGRRVDNPADLIPAIEDGLRRVAAGTPVLLNVICRPRGA